MHLCVLQTAKVKCIVLRVCLCDIPTVMHTLLLFNPLGSFSYRFFSSLPCNIKNKFGGCDVMGGCGCGCVDDRHKVIWKDGTIKVKMGRRPGYGRRGRCY